MRRVLILAVLTLALALPIGAWADGITLTNQFGTIGISGMAGTGGLGTIGTSTITSKGSQLTQFNGTTGNLGSVSYATGVLLSGSVSGGGTFDGGGAFDVTGKGAWASALTGEKCGSGCSLFAGSFSGPVAWTLVSSSGQKSNYTLSGNIQGMLWTGRLVSGSTVQNISILTKAQLEQGIGHITTGTTTLGAVPEPGTLGLLGTGLVAMGGMFRRKLLRG